MLTPEGVAGTHRLPNLSIPARESESPMRCPKDGAELYVCPDCDGQTRSGIGGGKLTCSTCRSTGLLCPTHEGHWK